MNAQETYQSREAEQFNDLVKHIQALKDRIGADAAPKDRERAMQFELDVDAAVATHDIEKVKSTIESYGISL